MRVVRYADFGARGDGRTDDLPAVVRAHAFANEHGLAVRADDDATYYLGGQDLTAVIQTDTDFGKAKFIIDDTAVQNRKANLFEVRSALEPIEPRGVDSLKRGQARLDAALPGPCVVLVTDANTKRFIRRGLNLNDGSSQTDVFLVNERGRVDPLTPIIWDFDQITEIIALPVDPEPLKITGGHFTTRANAAESRYTYYARGIAIRRSNVLVGGLEHHVVGEGDHGAPYAGFLNISRCANVTVRDTILTGRKTYRTIGRAGEPVSMGSYDIQINRALNVSLIDCRQTNDIMDRTYWGIMASNHSKNLRYERCTLSRFDAHQGVYHATITDSTLGYMGIQVIGGGTLRVETTTVQGKRFINLRPDYGSTWQGDFVIRDCVFKPGGGRGGVSLIGGRNDGQHDFGYACAMPRRIEIDGLHIDDAERPDDAPGPAIFADFNPRFDHPDYVEPFPYRKTRKVIPKDVTSARGKQLRLSDNPVMFEKVVIPSHAVP
ncbi:MAG: hypothetical protein GVY24_01180 [Planctomycetes bacterium]|nr:hypothetical protein [Planctomycetota bacterium]